MNRRRLRRDQGDAEVVGLVLIAPVVAAFVLLVFWLGRQVDTRTQIRQAAEAAAQAAARQRDPQHAHTAALTVATTMLATNPTCAGGPVVQLDLAGFQPGATVTATVRCRTARTGVELVAASDEDFTATSTAIIDTYRSGPLP